MDHEVTDVIKKNQVFKDACRINRRRVRRNGRLIVALGLVQKSNSKVNANAPGVA